VNCLVVLTVHHRAFSSALGGKQLAHNIGFLRIGQAAAFDKVVVGFSHEFM